MKLNIEYHLRNFQNVKYALCDMGIWKKWYPVFLNRIYVFEIAVTPLFSMMVSLLVIVFIPQIGMWVNWLFWICAPIEKIQCVRVCALYSSHCFAQLLIKQVYGNALIIRHASTWERISRLLRNILEPVGNRIPSRAVYWIPLTSFVLTYSRPIEVLFCISPRE